LASYYQAFFSPFAEGFGKKIEIQNTIFEEVGIGYLF